MRRRVAIVRSDGNRISVAPAYLLFDGVSGALLDVSAQSGQALTSWGTAFNLHMWRYVDPTLRWLYSAGACWGQVVARGLVLWTIKRRGKPVVGVAPLYRGRECSMHSRPTDGGRDLPARQPPAVAGTCWGRAVGSRGFFRVLVYGNAACRQARRAVVAGFMVVRSSTLPGAAAGRCRHARTAARRIVHRLRLRVRLSKFAVQLPGLALADCGALSPMPTPRCVTRDTLSAKWR